MTARHPRVFLSPGFILTAIIVAGVAIRLYRLDAPVLDAYAFRQTQTASEVWLWDRFGFSLFDYHVPVYGGGHWVLEFPWYQAMVFGLAKIFGFHDALGRLVSIGAFVASAWLLYQIGRRLLGSRAAAIAAVAFLAFMPITVFYYRAFLIDPTLIAVALLMFLATIRLWERFSWRWCAVFVGAFFVTALGKANLIVIFSLPMLVLIARAVRSRTLPRRGLAVMSAGIVLTVVALYSWTGHADALNIPSNGQTFSNMRWWFFGSTLFDANLWQTVGQRFFDNLSVAGVMFVGLGLAAIATIRTGHRAVLIALVASNLMSIAVFANLNRIHDYYQLPYYTTLALLGGLGVWSTGSLALRVSWARSVQVAAGVLSALAITWTLMLFQSTGYFAAGAVNYTMRDQAIEIATHTPDKPLVLLSEAADPNDPTILHEARRVAWRVPTEMPQLAEQRVREASGLGAIAIQKGPSGVPAWVAPLATRAGFRLTYDSPNLTVFSR